MALNVKVNQKAKLRIYNIAEYLEEEYSMQTARNFVQTVYKTIDKVAEHPTRGRKVPLSNTLQFINIDKHRQLFYRVHGTRLSVVDVFDTRQINLPTTRVYSHASFSANAPLYSPTSQMI